MVVQLDLAVSQDLVIVIMEMASQQMEKLAVLRYQHKAAKLKQMLQLGVKSVRKQSLHVPSMQIVIQNWVFVAMVNVFLQGVVVRVL